MFYCEDTHMNQYCLNCFHSYVTDENDELHCPFRSSKLVQNDEWCEKWKLDEECNKFLIFDFQQKICYNKYVRRQEQQFK